MQLYQPELNRIEKIFNFYFEETIIVVEYIILFSLIIKIQNKPQIYMYI